MGNGLYFTFSVFLVPLVEEFRWSRGLTAGALSLSTVLQGLLSPVAGILVDRFGPRPVILSGAVLLSAASILTERVTGKPLAEVDEMDFNDMIDELGREVVSTRPRCATLALGTLKAAVIQYRTDKVRRT